MSLQNLSISELLFIANNLKIIKFDKLIELILYDLYLKKIVGIERLKVVTPSSFSSDIFVWIDTNDYSGLNKVEITILDLGVGKSKLISLKEFISNGTRFSNRIIREKRRVYRIDELIIEGLCEKGIIIRDTIKSYYFFNRNKIKLTNLGADIAHKLHVEIYRNQSKQITNWFYEVYPNFKSNAEFFKSDFFIALKDRYDYYQKIFAMEFGIFTRIKTFPEPSW